MANPKEADSQTNSRSNQSGIPPESGVIPGRSLFGKRYTKAYKVRILELADKCTGPGEIGKMLRKEGLMHCTLTSFRKQRAAGYLDSVIKRSDHTDQTRRVLDLERENRKLKRKLEQAEAIIEVQKKVSRLLEVSLEIHEQNESGS